MLTGENKCKTCSLSIDVNRKYCNRQCAGKRIMNGLEYINPNKFTTLYAQKTSFKRFFDLSATVLFGDYLSLI